MVFRRQLSNLTQTYNDFPGQFWVLILGTFIDRLGGALLFPFFTLYITEKFGVGMTQVGVLFGAFSISSVVGGIVGGALTDRLGRKRMFLFGLVVSALSSLLMGFSETIELFFGVTLLVGLFANAGGPAQQAMVADLLPEEKRTQGYGIIRVVANLAVTIGPLLGAILIARTYLLLFISDAVTSLITAGIVLLVLQETRPVSEDGPTEETVGQTFAGYVEVLKDRAYLWLLGASVLMVLVYMQMNTTLAVYLRDSHGVTVREFGYILSLNAAMVVLFQFPITRWLDRFRPVLVMAAGTLLYAIGFGMYGFVSSYALFLLAMVIITIGEMLVTPVAQAVVSRMAPEDMRGRYMAIFEFSWLIPVAIGPLLAGVIMDNTDPRWVWYAAGIVALVAAGAFAALQGWIESSQLRMIRKRLDILEMLEEMKITAEDANRRLQAVKVGSWARLSAEDASQGGKTLHIRVSDRAAGAMKTDLRLPMGLVNTILHVGGQLSDDLDPIDQEQLREAITASRANQSVEKLGTDGEDSVEISVEVD